jgi:hypothetical protein
MKTNFTVALAILASSLSVLAETTNQYFNYGVTNAPTLDVVSFVNYNVFDALVSSQGAIPYTTLETLYYTNQAPGYMLGQPGFDFEDFTLTGGVNPSAQFYNSGTIVGEDTATTPSFPIIDGGFDWQVGTGAPIPSVITIAATNIYNAPGSSIAVGADGVLKMIGQNITNRQNFLIAGDETGNDTYDQTSRQEGDYLGTQAGSTTPTWQLYNGPPTIFDIYWGWTNKTGPPGELSPAALASAAIPRTNGGFNGTAPAVAATERASGSGTAANIFPLSGPGFTNYIFSYTNFPNPTTTNVYYNIVIVDSGALPTNVKTTVSFSPAIDGEITLIGGANPPNSTDPNALEDVVQFSEPVFDAISNVTVTNSIYLADGGAYLSNTFTLFTNIGPGFGSIGYQRPSAFVLSLTPLETGMPSNDVFDASSTGLSNLLGGFGTLDGGTAAWSFGTPQNGYPYWAAVYAAQVGMDPEFLSGSIDGENFGIPPADQEPARIEIDGDNVDLGGARIRSEGLVTINATNLVGQPAVADWGTADANLNVASGSLLITNLFPQTFTRLRGDIEAWSGNWYTTGSNVTGMGTNAVTNTVNVSFHMLIVLPLLQGQYNSTIQNLTLNGARSVDIEDPMDVINQALFKTPNLTIGTNVTLEQNAQNLEITNVPGLQSLVLGSNGNLFVDNEINLGVDTTKNEISPVNRPYAIGSMVNNGQIFADTVLFQSSFFENDGTIDAAGSSGTVVLNAQNLILGNQANLTEAGGNITLSGATIAATNSTISAGSASSPGTLSIEMGPSGKITDFYPQNATPTTVSVNFWEVFGGFNLPVKPLLGDLYGTTIETVATGYNSSLNTWAGRADFTNFLDGFTNNAVIGKLIISRQSTNAQLIFSGVGASNAMYVDNLQFSGTFTTNLSNGLTISPNLTIYYRSVKPATITQASLQALYPGQFVQITNALTNLTYEPPASSLIEFTNNTFSAVKGTYYGLFSTTNQATPTNSGFFTFTLSGTGGYSGKLMMGPVTYTFSGTGTNKFDVTNGLAHAIAKHGGESLDVSLQLMDTVSGTGGQVSGTVSNAFWSATLQGYLKPDWTAKLPSPYAGRYTLILTNTPTNSEPGGYSYGAVDVSKTGVLTAAGKLADDVAFSQSVPISDNGDWPLYAYEPSGKDYLFAWLNFNLNDVGASSIIETNIVWDKGSVPNARFYPAGFASTPELISSPYIFPGPHVSGLTELVTPEIILTGAGVASQTNIAVFNGKLKYSTTDATLNFNPTTGVFTGNFKPDSKGPSTPLSGVVLQNDVDSGFGFFLGADHQTGTVILQTK